MQNQLSSNSRYARFWLYVFVGAGLYSLVCIPLIYLFEFLHWQESFFHISIFGACIVCVTGAAMYLVLLPGNVGKQRILHIPTRLVACLAILLAGGWLMLIVLFVLLWVLFPPGF